MESKLKVIVSGGGTGGHIFPAISIADAIKAARPDAEILFVGAKGRMEMTRVPAAGYKIVGLPICGFDRKNPFKNIAVLLKLVRSQIMARKLLKDFCPDVVVGVGGYASGPTLRMAGKLGIPTLIQEQNSYAGVTNKLLAKDAAKICVAYEGMERFFPEEKIMVTGNPVRRNLVENKMKRSDAARQLNLDPSKRILLIVGGSLGARTLNESVMANLDLIRISDDVQIIWQTGKYYFEEMKQRLAAEVPVPNLFPTDFISDMDAAYGAADLVVSRAGAGTISELCLLKKPVILVPSPNVAEDHQTKNAMALANKDAAIHIADVSARKELMPVALDVVKDMKKLEDLSANIFRMALKDSAEIIANEVLKLAKADKAFSIDNVESVYFIGAGGIGMSALIRYFLKSGKKVAGYDKTPSDLTNQLISEGADIHYDEGVELIPEYCKQSSKTLVVYTPAIPAEHKEFVWFRENGFEIQKRAQVLGTLTRTLDGLCVAGTHGKTTTSTMVAHIMNMMPDGCNAFLGGISKNYGSNLLQSEKSNYVVIEADEFDRSFHHLTPLRSVITAMDADHLDIYGTYENYIESFRHYSSLIKSGGALIVNTAVAELLKPRLAENVSLYTYSIDNGDFHAENIRIGRGTIVFDFVGPDRRIADIELGVPVRVNIENGIAAIAMALLSGATDEAILKGMATFRGCDRRFDFHLKEDNVVYVSDYAHHPEELRQCAISMKELYAGSKVTAIFQPHLYTRTRDFYKEFADSLSLFDEVYLVDIYPARELPIEGVTSQLIADNMKSGICKAVISLSQVPEVVERIKADTDVLVTVGAGDLENYVPKIVEILKSK
ncbi:MAG: UDP-N-acetylmuramate--L-alanine ligase [Bacteroidaceae bacterium]|nr:UDP-N-acetylmuramate--L-alanine ligase [Bacteroidaceae bacterium]